jgi:hypothetical protein
MVRSPIRAMNDPVVAHVLRSFARMKPAWAAPRRITTAFLGAMKGGKSADTRTKVHERRVQRVYD